MLSDNARSALQGAPHNEIVGGKTDVPIIAASASTLNVDPLGRDAREIEFDEREYQLRLRSLASMSTQLGIPFEELWRALNTGSIVCSPDSRDHLLFDPVVVELHLRKEARSMGEWGDSQRASHLREGVSP
jgi:hypothetical protein